MVDEATPVEKFDPRNSLENILGKVEPQKEDSKDKILRQEDINFQLGKLREIDKAGTNRGKIIKAATEEAESQGIAKEIILSWIYAPEIERRVGVIFNLAEKKGKEQVFDILTGSASNSKTAHDIAHEINYLLYFLGHKWNSDNHKNYGPIAEVGKSTVDGPLAASVRELQKVLTVVDDGMAGTTTLTKLKELLASQDGTKKEISAKEKAEFDQIIAEHSTLLAKLRDLRPDRFTIKGIDLDLDPLSQYDGQNLKMTNPDGTTTDTVYSSQNILQAKNATSFASFGATNGILQAEVEVLKRAVAEIELENEVEAKFKETTYLYEGITIYQEYLPKENSDRALLKGDELLSLRVESAMRALLRPENNWQQVLTGLQVIWERLPENTKTKTKGTEVFKNLLIEGLNTQDALHWQEAELAIPNAPAEVLEALSAFTARLPKAEGIKDLEGNPRETPTLFNEEVARLLQVARQKETALEALEAVLNVAERSKIEKNAQYLVTGFFNTPEARAIVRRGFRDAQNLDSEKRSALIERMRQSIPAETKAYQEVEKLSARTLGLSLNQAVSPSEEQPNTEATEERRRAIEVAGERLRELKVKVGNGARNFWNGVTNLFDRGKKEGEEKDSMPVATTPVTTGVELGESPVLAESEKIQAKFEILEGAGDMFINIPSSQPLAWQGSRIDAQSFEIIIPGDLNLETTSASIGTMLKGILVKHTKENGADITILTASTNIPTDFQVNVLEGEPGLQIHLTPKVETALSTEEGEVTTEQFGGVEVPVNVALFPDFKVSISDNLDQPLQISWSANSQGQRVKLVTIKNIKGGEDENISAPNERSSGQISSIRSLYQLFHQGFISDEGGMRFEVSAQIIKSDEAPAQVPSNIMTLLQAREQNMLSEFEKNVNAFNHVVADKRGGGDIQLRIAAQNIELISGTKDKPSMILNKEEVFRMATSAENLVSNLEAIIDVNSAKIRWAIQINETENNFTVSFIPGRNEYEIRNQKGAVLATHPAGNVKSFDDLRTGLEPKFEGLKRI